MRLLYTVSLYKRPDQFAWLWRTIYNRHDAYVLHVDRKTPDDVLKGFEEVVGAASNVLWLPRRSVVWMGPELVAIELEAMRAGFNHFGGFDYLWNLSGQDLQITSRETIVNALKAHPERNYVSMEPLKNLPFHIRRRPYLVSFKWGDRLVKTPLPRPIPQDLKIHWKGSWWHGLSRGFCAWILESAKADAYRRFFHHVQAPDELFFQNVIMDSPFADTMADRNRTFVQWNGIGGSPDTLTMASHDELTRSSLFFARKFDCVIDHKIVGRIAQCSPEGEVIRRYHGVPV